MAQIGVIINPYAKKNKGGKAYKLKEKIQKLAGEDAIVEVTESIEDLEKLVKIFKQEGIKYLAISGGDGTMHSAITYFLKEYNDPNDLPILVPLKGGTMNILAVSLKAKGNSFKIFKKFYKMYKENNIKTAYRKTLEINGRYGNIFAAGAASYFMDYYYEGGNPGPWKAFLTILRSIMDAFLPDRKRKIIRTTEIEAIVDGEKLPLKRFLAAITVTVKNMPLGFQLMYRAYEEEGKFHIFITNAKPLKLVINLPKIYFGKPIKANEHFDLLAKEVILKTPKGSKYTIDGDLFVAEDGVMKISIYQNLKYVDFS